MMGRKALLAVICWIAVSECSAKAVQPPSSAALADNVSAESAPPLYRDVGAYAYASAAPYAAFSFHVPQYVAPNFNHVPLSQERILAQSTNNYLRDSYGQRFVEAPQAYAYKAALQQQYVPLQKLPAHLSQPLVAAAPNAQYGQATHFFGAPFTLANLQAVSPQNGNPFGVSQPLVYSQNVRTFASPAQKESNGQPVAQQQTTSNTHNSGQYSRFWNEPKVQVKQEDPKISASDNKENQQIVQSLPLVHAPKQTTITSFTNGKKTVVNLITKPPVPLLDLTLLEPLTFDNPLVPQVQHFLPKIHSVTYKKLPELNQKKVITIKRKTTKKTKKQKPQVVHDEIEVSHKPSISNDHNTELSYEVNSPNYKETISEKKVSYNKETTSKPVVISYEKKTEMKPVTYSYGKHTQKEPVHYNYVHTSNEPAQLKQAYLDENKEKTKHLIYHFSPDELSEEENEQGHNSDQPLESVEIIEESPEENPSESISEEVPQQQEQQQRQQKQHHEPQRREQPIQQHEHLTQHQHQPQTSQPHHSQQQKHNEPQQHKPYERREQQHYEPQQYHEYEPQKHEHLYQQHHQQLQKYIPQQQHKPYEAQHYQQHQNHGQQHQKQHAPQQQQHDKAQHELAEEAYNEPNQNFREEPEPEDREVAYYQNSKENIETEPREEVYYENPKNTHGESREKLAEPIEHKSSPQRDEKQYEAIVPEYEEDITILPAHKSHAPIHAEENSDRGSIKQHNSHPKQQREQAHYDYPQSYYSPPVPQEKSNRIIVKDDPPQQKEEVYKPNDELIEAMVKKQEESEEDFEQAYKNAAYGFPAYEAPVRNVDREKEIYNPANYGAPRYHNDYDDEKSALRQYEPEGDDYPAQMRSNYKDTRDKTNDDYYTDYSASKPQNLVEGKKKKEEYYDSYNDHKPQKYYAKDDDSDNQQSAKYTVAPVYNYPGAPQQKFAKFISRISPLDEYHYVKEAPIDSTAFGTGTYSSKMQLLEPHYQYGFEPIRVSRLLDRELSAMASDHSPETVKKMYKENFYIEKSSTSKVTS